MPKMQEHFSACLRSRTLAFCERDRSRTRRLRHIKKGPRSAMKEKGPLGALFYMVEAAGIEPASESPTSPDLHA